MERLNYDNHSVNELYDILDTDLLLKRTPKELTGVARCILEVEFVSGEILKGFLNFCDDYEEWAETTSCLNKDVNTYIRYTYDLNDFWNI